MLALLSPAKKLDMDTSAPTDRFTAPHFTNASLELNSILREMSSEDLQDLIGISENLGRENHERNQAFRLPFNLNNAKQAAWAFRGDTYVGLDADTLKEDDYDYLADHIMILSGLYGILRPFDLMMAYRLEMGTRLKTERGKNLYEFWGNELTDFVNDSLKDHKDKTVIKLASKEYISAISEDALTGGMVTPEFKELKDGKPKMIGIYAKRARGMMARYMIDNKVETVEALKSFDMGGYQFQPQASNDKTLVFLRDQN